MKFSKKLSNKIWGFSFITISLTLLLLTVLMHFKYKMTRLDLINARYSILLNDMKWAIERGMSLGVDLSELKNVQHIIDDGLQKDKTIKDIVVFNFKNNKNNNIFATHPDELQISSDISKRIIEALYSTKKEFWSIEINEQRSFVGINFTDALGIITGGIYLVYSPEIIKKNSQEEIKNLYLRMLAFLSVIFLVSYIISYKTIKHIESSLTKISTYLDVFIKSPKEADDPTKIPIEDIDLRQEFIKSVKNAKVTFKSLGQLRRLCDDK
jgi:hypothetical protein